MEAAFEGHTGAGAGYGKFTHREVQITNVRNAHEATRATDHTAVEVLGRYGQTESANTE